MNEGSFLFKLANHIQNSYDLTRQELTVVFPNKRAAYYLRKAFKMQCKKTLWLPQMISIEEAVAEWSGFTIADNIDLLFALIDIDAQLHVEKNSDLNVFGSQAAQMAKDFDEIDQYGIDAHYVFSYVLDNKRLEYWNFDDAKSKEKEIKYLHFFHSLYDYYLKLRGKLTEQGKGYYGLITRYLSELPEKELLKKIGERNILFAGFNALTTTEERIIDTLIKNDKANIIFDYDAYYLDDENNEAGLFARRHRKNHPEWLKDGISQRLQKEEKHISVIMASGNAMQAKALQAQLQEMADGKQAVVLADERLLIPVLNAIPNNPAYDDFKVSMGYPIEKAPVNQLVKAYFTLCRQNIINRTVYEEDSVRFVNGWPLWPIIRFLDLEIVKIIIPREEIAIFNSWKNEVVCKGKFILEAIDIDAMEQTPNIQEFLGLALAKNHEKSPLQTLYTINSLLSFVANRMLSNKDNADSLFLLNQVSEIGNTISKLHQIIGRNTDYITDLQSIEVLYRLVSSGITVKLNSNSTEGLQIMGLLETRNLDFTKLHLLSVNEGILPTEKSQSSFIPPFIRKECGLPGYTEKQAVFAYHFYHLLQNSSDIHLYFNNLDETSGGEASRFILQIKHELAKNDNIHYEESIFCQATTPSLKINSLVANKQDSFAWLQHHIKDKGLSPSSLATYISCPLKYYLKYVVGIEDNGVKEEVATNIIGNIIHDTLQFLFEPYKMHEGKKQIIDKKLFDQIIMPQWETMLTHAIGKNMPKGFSDIGFNYLNSVSIKQQLKNYMQYMSNELKDNVLCIIKTEDAMETHLYTEQGVCRFFGRTDRIDQYGGIIRVIDYKTGHVESANVKVPVRHFSVSNLDYLRTIPEKALQLMLYKYLYLKQNPEIQPGEVIAAIHGLKYTKNIEFGLSRTVPKIHDTDADQSFLDDDRFIDDMEALLRAVVGEILDVKVPFVQTDNGEHCRNCDFQGICRR